MLSPTKLVLALVALSSFTSALPTAADAEINNLQARGDCYGYANATECFSARYKAICSKVINIHKLGCRVQRTQECNEACSEN
ncbi:hypothetical protein ACHAPT_002788 [Fusarium lateritium]